MRIPKGISLATYIRQLIKEDRIEEFYQTDDWKELRLDVLDDFNQECQKCLKKGEYTHANCVHHVNEVKHRPDLAMSRTYIDKDGQEQIQLLPLCNTCHNIVHDKLGEWQKKDKFTNQERW